MDVFAQQIINGLSVGAIYALIAVGYTMVYGVLRLINFAHGDLVMVGAMLCLYAARMLGLESSHSLAGFFLVSTIAVVACGTLGFLIELLAYRPLRNQPRITSLITAIGISLFLEFGGQAVFGPTPQAFSPREMLAGHADTRAAGAGEQSSALTGALHFGDIVVDRVDVVILIVTLTLMVLLTWIVMRTRGGLALRAVSHRFDTAALMGVNINRTVSFTFVLGSLLAGVAGVLYGVKYPKVEPLMGLLPGIKAFIAAVLGGIGNIGGAVVGGLLLGIVEVLVVGYLPAGSQYRDGVAFVILIAILLVKPSGLLGRNAVEKV